jgi:Fur family ferric uptake transcriptional regulator
MNDAALHTVIQKLREQNVKLTRPRMAVVQLLMDAKTHLSADELVDRVKAKGLRASRATVYRLISVLRQCGVIDVHDFDQRKRVVEPMVGRVHHDHLYCIGCGKIIEFANEQIEKLQDKILKEHQFHMIYHSHKIFGYCRACHRKERS